MKKLEGACPSCGGTVEFRHDSALVVICPWCHSAVARGDRQLENRGRVADLVETNSRLALGHQGRFRDKPFEIVGHTQYRHAAGGTWDEWYAAFPGGRWGWIAEAQGKLLLTVLKKAHADQTWPRFEALSAGETLQLGHLGQWTVVEVGTATMAGAEGELPQQFSPGASHRFADLSGPEGRFATLDFNASPPRLFAGYEVTPAELELPEIAPAEQEAHAVNTVGLACPQCGGSLELKAPDAAQRVACPFCAALLDVNEGQLKYLSTLKKPPHLLLSLGSTGTLFGVAFTVIGFVRRAVRFDREYTWDEYLLYASGTGFRWLVHSDGHWSFVEPVPLGDVRRTADGATFEGVSFRLFQRAWARVKYVLGEFYWKVSVGETVLAEDSIAPPRMLTLEFSPLESPPSQLSGSGRWPDYKYGETNVSLATYVPHATVETAFGVKLPRTWAVAPNQPRPIAGEVYWHWLGFLGLLVVICYAATLWRTDVDPWNLLWASALVSVPALGAFVFNYNFEMTRWADSEFNPYQGSDDDD